MSEHKERLGRSREVAGRASEPEVTHEILSALERKDRDRRIVEIMNRAMAMALEAIPSSASGFGGDTRMVKTDTWAAAVLVEDGKAKKVKAVWIPEHSREEEDRFWQGIVPLPVQEES